MPLTRVQFVTHEEAVSLVANTTTISAPAVGSLIVAAIGGDKNLGADLAVPSGFTRVGSPYIGASTTRDLAWKISDGTETNIVWAYGGAGQTGNNSLMAVAVYTGNAASPFDVAAANDSANANVSSLATGTTGATAQADELAFAIATIDSTGGGKTPSWDSGFTRIGTDFYGSNAGLTIAEKDLSSTGAVSATVTLAAGSDQMAAAVVTFKASLTQTISGAGGIASAEALGTTAVANVLSILNPSAIASAEAFGTAVFSTAITLLQDGFDRTTTSPVVGTPDVGPAWVDAILDTGDTGACNGSVFVHTASSNDSYCYADNPVDGVEDLLFAVSSDKLASGGNPHIEMVVHAVGAQSLRADFRIRNTDQLISAQALHWNGSSDISVTSITVSSVTHTIGVKHWFRVQAVREYSGGVATGVRIRARVWNDGDTEPGTWLIDAVDTTPALLFPSEMIDVSTRLGSGTNNAPVVFTWHSVAATKTTQVISASGIASTEAFGTAKLNQIIAPPSIDSGEGFGTPTFAATTIARDAFNRVEAAGSIGNADVGGAWTPYTYVEPSTALRVNGTAFEFTHMVVNDGGGGATLPIATRDMEINLRFRRDKIASSTTQYFYLLLRDDGAGHRYLVTIRYRNNGTLTLEVGGTSSVATADITAREGAPEPNVWVLVRARISGANNTVLRVKAWKETHSEPAGWDIDVTDTGDVGPQVAGSFAFEFYKGANTVPVISELDDLVISSIPDRFITSVGAITSQEAFGTPATSGTGTVVIDADTVGIESAEAFGTPSLAGSGLGTSDLGGAYSVYTATGSLPPDVVPPDFGGVSAKSESNNANLTVTLPAGLVAGDLMVACVYFRNRTGSISTPAGWTLLTPPGAGIHATGPLQAGVYTRFWQSGDAAPVFVPSGGSAGDTLLGQIFIARGANATPITVATAWFQGTTATNSDLPVPVGGSLTAEAGSMVVLLGIVPDDYTAPDSVDTLTGNGLTWNEISEVNTTLGLDGSFVWDYAQIGGAAVPISDKTFASTARASGGSNSPYLSIGFVIRPAITLAPSIGADYSTDGSVARVRHSLPDQSHFAALMSATGQDVHVQVWQRFPGAPSSGFSHAGVLARVVDIAGTYYVGQFSIDSSGNCFLIVGYHSGGVATTLSAIVIPDLEFNPASRYLIELETVGTNPTSIRARATEEGAVAGSWLIQLVDSAAALQVSGGAVGWANSAGNYPSYPVYFEVDDFFATAATATAEAFGTPTATIGGQTLFPTGVVSLQAFGATALVGAGIAPIGVVSIDSAEAFGDLGVIFITAQYLVPTGIVSGQVFGLPILIGGGTIVIPVPIHKIWTIVSQINSPTTSTTDIPQPDAEHVSAVLAPYHVSQLRLFVKWDGVNWTEEANRVVGATGSESTHPDFKQPDTGEATIELNNYDGRYTRTNSASPLYSVLSRRRPEFYILAGWNEQLDVAMRGTVEDLDATKDRATLKLLDKTADAKDTTTSVIAMTNKRTDEWIVALLTGAGLQPPLPPGPRANPSPTGIIILTPSPPIDTLVTGMDLTLGEVTLPVTIGVSVWASKVKLGYNQTITFRLRRGGFNGTILASSAPLSLTTDSPDGHTVSWAATVVDPTPEPAGRYVVTFTVSETAQSNPNRILNPNATTSTLGWTTSGDFLLSSGGSISRIIFVLESPTTTAFRISAPAITNGGARYPITGTFLAGRQYEVRFRVYGGVSANSISATAQILIADAPASPANVSAPFTFRGRSDNVVVDTLLETSSGSFHYDHGEYLFYWTPLYTTTNAELIVRGVGYTIDIGDFRVTEYFAPATGTIYSDTRMFTVTPDPAEPIPPVPPSIDVGETVIPYSIVPYTPLWPELVELAYIEQGRVFYDSDGVLQFWSRSKVRRSWSAPVIALDTYGHLYEYSHANPSAEYANVVRLEWQPRSEGPLGTAWSLGGPLKIPPEQRPITITATIGSTAVNSSAKVPSTFTGVILSILADAVAGGTTTPIALVNSPPPTLPHVTHLENVKDSAGVVVGTIQVDDGPNWALADGKLYYQATFDVNKATLKFWYNRGPASVPAVYVNTITLQGKQELSVDAVATEVRLPDITSPVEYQVQLNYQIDPAWGMELGQLELAAREHGTQLITVRTDGAAFVHVKDVIRLTDRTQDPPQTRDVEVRRNEWSYRPGDGYTQTLVCAPVNTDEYQTLASSMLTIARAEYRLSTNVNGTWGGGDPLIWSQQQWQ